FAAARPAEFRGRAVWAALDRLHLLRAEETASRVAYLAVPQERVLVSFSLEQATTLIWRGARLEWGEMMLHGPGERLHQRTIGPSCWGLVSLPPPSLGE